MKNYTWLIAVQVIATASDLYTCGSISGRSLMIPFIVLLIVFAKDLWKKPEGSDYEDKH